MALKLFSENSLLWKLGITMVRRRTLSRCWKVGLPWTLLCISYVKSEFWFRKMRIKFISPYRVWCFISYRNIVGIIFLKFYRHSWIAIVLVLEMYCSPSVKLWVKKSRNLPRMSFWGWDFLLSYSQITCKTEYCIRVFTSDKDVFRVESFCL